MSAAPKLQRLVLFKHGIAYLERGGPADGPFELRFRNEEMNDVLKSLTAYVVSGDARVGAVSFESADDPAEALAARNLLAAQGESLQNIVLAARGRKVRADDGAVREGEVLGLEITQLENGAQRKQLVLREPDGGIATVELGSLRRLQLCDPSSVADLDLLIDKSKAMTAGDARVLTVALHGKADDVRVAYIVPAPTWRVSYRLALADDGPARILAWAIVHNPADEDVEAAELVLTTGQPVSFEIDLYKPKRLRRTVVEEETRVASAPRRMERGGPPPPPGPPARAMAAMPASAPAPASFGAPAAFAVQAQVMGDAFQAIGAGAAHLAERGELFEYRVADPVSLKRGGSAMVPIVTGALDVARDRIWRLGDPPPPDLVASFENTSGAVLEEGPAVVYEGGGYAGEAMIPYSARGARVRFAYAKDLGVRCTSTTTWRDIMVGVRVLESTMVEDQLREFTHTVRIESDHEEEVKVLVEMANMPGRRLRKGEPVETGAKMYRFAVTVPPRGVGETSFVEGQANSRSVAYGGLDVQQIARWLEGKFLDEQIAGSLKEIVAMEDEARMLDQGREHQSRVRQEKHEEIQRLAHQLSVLAQQGAEGHLRLRYAEQMEAAQRAVSEAEGEMRSLEKNAEKKRAEARELLRDLVAERTETKQTEKQ
jgi:hypothetical protein